MSYKDFLTWCNRRACDGCWDSNTVLYCLSIMKYIDSLPFWKRNKAWRVLSPIIEKEVVEVIEKKLKELNLNA